MSHVKAAKYVVEYMLQYVDHIPVTMEYETYEEAKKLFDEVGRYKDLRMRRLYASNNHKVDEA